MFELRSPVSWITAFTRVCILTLWAFVAASPGTPLTPLCWPQTSNSIEGIKLILEGQRLAETGTRASLTEAIDRYKAAFTCFQKDNLKEGMGMALFASGAAYSSLAQRRRALDAFLEGSTYLKETGDPSMYAMSLAGIGIAYTYLSEWNKAFEYLNQALPLLRKGNNSQALGAVLCALGGAYVKSGQKQKGLEYLEKALGLARETRDKKAEVQALLLMGANLSALGQKRKALESTEQCLQISRELKDRALEATSLMSLGEVHDTLGDRQRALNDYNEALQVGREANDWVGKATVLNNTASIYEDMGQIDRAMALYEESARISEVDGEPEEAAGALNGIGGIYQLRAEPLRALIYYNKGLALTRAAKDRGREAAALINIALVHSSYNEYEQALKANSEAVDVFKAIEDPAGESTALSNLGSIYNKLGRDSEALACLNRALELQRTSDNKRGQARTLTALGDAYSVAGDVTKALGAYSDALRLMKSVEDRTGEAIVNNNLAFVYDRQGDFQNALEFYQSALSLTRSANDLRGEATVLANLGFLHERQGDLEGAEDLYARAIEAHDRIRTAAHLEEFKTEVANTSAELHSRAILLKSRLGKLPDAFELTERARARTFLDQISSVRLDFRKGADPELVEQEQSLHIDIGLLEKRLRDERVNNPSSEAGTLIAASLKEKQEAYAPLLIRLEASNPDFAELESYSALSLGEVQSLLTPQTTLVSYFVTPDKTLAFVLTSNSFNAVEITVKEAELRAAVNWFRGFPSLRDPQPASLKQLHEWLIRPIQQYIKTSEVAIVPHGILHYLPFAALTDGQRYFGEDHSIYYLPSASILQALRRRIHPEGKAVLAAAQSRAEGLPALRYADEEAESVAKMYGAQPLSTGRSTKAEFLKRAGPSNVLHIAAHAELNAHSPLFSRILLTPDKDDSGAIEVREVYGMDLTKANLVVLSACETQLGAQSKGDDIIGLNRAFIYAGAPTVIASLWTVDDESTSVLMKAFYTHLKSGMSKAEALQAAQSDTRKKYPHPYYWAGFVLTGDPGKNRRK
jgi:CHAT domain-containing protein/tetratricopeptide (TPR) repeat protein